MSCGAFQMLSTPALFGLSFLYFAYIANPEYD